MKKTLLLILTFLAFTMQFSCNNYKPVYDEVVAIGSDGWRADNPLEFQVSVIDTSKVYDLLLHIRNTRTYDYRNLWLFIETIAPNGQSYSDTVEVILADESGRWLGKGIGNVNAMLEPYITGVKFAYRGVYTIILTQGMREESLEDILDIGLRVVEHKNKKK